MLIRAFSFITSKTECGFENEDILKMVTGNCDRNIDIFLYSTDWSYPIHLITTPCFSLFSFDITDIYFQFFQDICKEEISKCIKKFFQIPKVNPHEINVLLILSRNYIK